MTIGSALLSRRGFARLAPALPLAGLTAAQTPRRPNFLVILADDMGFSDAGCYGGEIDTPNLDALARRGIRFTQAYSTARCGPSRSCLLTGYYAQQTASDVMTRGNIPRWTRFLPQYLAPHGYRSYHSGKWHIRFRPVAGAGFHHSYSLNDQNRFFTPGAHLLDDQRLPPVKESEAYYATSAIGDHTVRMLKEHAREHRDRPFFMYTAFTSPHFPLHALQQDIDAYRDRFSEGWDVARELRLARMRRMGLVNCPLSPLEPDMRPPWNTPDADLLAKIGPGEVTRAVPWATLKPEQRAFQRTKMAIHAAMITRMDHEIGRIIAQLKAMDTYDNTVVLFLSDNGASSEQLIRADGHDPAAAPGSARSHLCLGPGWSSAANTPFRLHKSWVHEGGISSPLIVHWPAGIRAASLRHDPCHFIDVVPTLLQLAGAGALPAAEGAPPLPGRSLAPAFARDRTVTRDFLYFSHAGNRAIRSGDWKLVSAGKDGPWELYDMRMDRSERRNLAAAQPARASQLAQLWTACDQDFDRAREAASPMPKERF